MAAESYLDQKDDTGFNKALKFGNNNPRFHDDEAALPGATRMTAVQITDFNTKFEIVAHVPNDETGLSMTLFRRKTPDPLTGAKEGDYTLSFRSTEFADPKKGGDWDRDGVSGADGQVLGVGIVLNQHA